MRTYYVFIIKDSLMHFYSRKPYSLYKILEQIYNLKNNDIVLGYRLLDTLSTPFGRKKTDKYIYERHCHELSYSKNNYEHKIKNIYSNEITLLKVFNSHLKIESNTNYSSFFNSIGGYSDNLFVCDFINRDYFWISKIKFESIV